MRYIDTGSRDPQDAVGTWLESTMAGGETAALRLQSAYVGPEPFGYLEPVLCELAVHDGPTSIVVGSNNGETARETIEDLIRLAGKPRPHLKMGVVSFVDGLFHPKVYHIVRHDGSMAAYVGSANFTYAGISGKNVEAGIALDTRLGDDPGVLDDILDVIDGWFAGGRPGFFPVNTTADLPRLVVDGVLGAPRPRRTAARVTAGGTRGQVRDALRGLVRLPAISSPMAVPPPAPPAPAFTAVTAGSAVVPTVVEWWSKTIRSSDAQRKPGGNQSGVIVLTQAHRRGQIDQTKYFRNDLFGGLVWQQVKTRTGHMKDVAQVLMHTTVLGNDLGLLTFEVTHDHVREAKQNNYTTTLALGPIRTEFDQANMIGRTITIIRDAAGEYWLEIS